MLTVHVLIYDRAVALAFQPFPTSTSYRGCFIFSLIKIPIKISVEDKIQQINNGEYSTSHFVILISPFI